MATYYDNYVVNIFVDKRKEVPVDNISFSLVDSIYSLYSYVMVSYDDVTGLIQEGLGLEQGMEYTIEFGNKDILNKATYVVDKNMLEEIQEPGYLGGKVAVMASHNWKNKQTIKNKAYKDRISRVVRDLVDPVGFDKVEINDTGNEDIWYQLYKTDAKFIKDTLLPNAFSKNAKNTPFYCFTTTNNEFHFRNTDSMLSKEVAAEIEYLVNPGFEQEGDNTQYNQTTTIKRWTTDPKENWHLRKRHLFKISREDGTLEEDEDNIIEYPSKNNLDLPILGSDGTDYTGYDFFQFTETETGRKENLDGYKTNAFKEGFFIDRFMLIIPMNPKIHAGKTIKLRIYTRDNNNESKRYSGVYIVENCEQIWDGPITRAYTKLIVGRKYIQIPSSYNLKTGLLS